MSRKNFQISNSCFGDKKRRLDDDVKCESLPAWNGVSHIPRVICKEMCLFCFDVLHNYIYKMDPPNTPVTFPNHSYPLFVTWKYGKDHKLRGCIGTFTAMHLHNGLREYALSSALRDSRFEPITEDEFPNLLCSVSILLNFEEGAHYQDWQIGIHGIRIEFVNERGQRKSATYLPEVAMEQGWNHRETIDSLLRKGGYRASINESVRQSIRLTRYRSEKLTLHAQEYLRERQGGVRV